MPPPFAEQVTNRESAAVERSSLFSPDRPSWVVTTLSAVTSSSFPSAHTTVAAAFTTAVLARHRRWGTAVTPLALGVAYSRIRTRAHWPTDIAAGAVCGVLIGVAIHKSLRP
jgi:membrane-associated phospholipid phosphatase